MREPLSLFAHHSRKRWIGLKSLSMMGQSGWWYCMNREGDSLRKSANISFKGATSRNIGSAIHYVPILIVFSNISVYRPFDLNSISNVLAGVIHLKDKIGCGMYQGLPKKFNTNIRNEWVALFVLQNFQRLLKFSLMNSEHCPSGLWLTKIRDKGILPKTIDDVFNGN